MKKMISFVVVLSLIFTSLAVSAFAEVSNTIKGGGNNFYDTSSANGPGPYDIASTGDDDVIKMPMMSSYLDYYAIFYVDAPKGHSVYAYTHPDAGNSQCKSMPFAYHGVRVYALAVENGYVCGMYPTEDNELRTAWISEKNLSSTFPGISFVAGEQKYGADYTSYFAKVKWSKTPFIGTNTIYTEIVDHDGPSNMVDGIAFEYQVLSRQGKGDVSGARDVYINDGSGWEYVGSYDLEPYNTPVRVTIYFDYPVAVKAVATVPQDPKIEGFIFRQFVTDMLFIE